MSNASISDGCFSMIGVVLPVWILSIALIGTFLGELYGDFYVFLLSIVSTSSIGFFIGFFISWGDSPEESIATSFWFSAAWGGLATFFSIWFSGLSYCGCI